MLKRRSSIINKFLKYLMVVLEPSLRREEKDNILRLGGSGGNGGILGDGTF